jgi:hypothetical protein
MASGLVNPLVLMLSPVTQILLYASATTPAGINRRLAWAGVDGHLYGPLCVRPHLPFDFQGRGKINNIQPSSTVGEIR